MRSSHLFYSLCAAAPLAMGTPVLPHLVLVKTLDETVSDPSSGPKGYQPATITTARAEGSRTEILQPLDRQSVIEGAAEPAFDNRPLPSTASEISRLASAVLSSAGPLSSDLLEALSKLQSAHESSPPSSEETETESETESEPSPRKTKSVGSLVRLASKNRDGGVLRIKHSGPAEDSKAMTVHQPRPCGAHHADVLVIGMVLTFLLVVLMMETWRPVSRTVRRIFRNEGAIRLQDDVETARATSVRAPGLDIPETIYEKQEEGHDDDDDDSDCGAEPWVI
ncbi:hypothetical protein N8I77_010550 [Diaporthe amygdali]|uniref:Transmembrane protein n=1 Tax=Phomopsis amygdali TaxID=1214568 RepID=A0AAD9W1Y6_PHOAM|nr:hypothetical protein N8I77_010550 [Diaporthe amygdali]